MKNVQRGNNNENRLPRKPKRGHDRKKYPTTNKKEDQRAIAVDRDKGYCMTSGKAFE